MITHEEEIQEIVAIDYEILDVILEKQIRDLFNKHNQVLSDRMLIFLMPLQWLGYAQWN